MVRFQKTCDQSSCVVWSGLAGAVVEGVQARAPVLARGAEERLQPRVHLDARDDPRALEDVDQAHATLNTSTNKEQIAKAVALIAENTPGVSAEAIDPLGSTAFQLGYLQSTLAHTNRKIAELEKTISMKFCG